MSIVKAGRLQAVLEKARNAGHAEETACIAGLNLVFRSLQPQDYNAILKELEDVAEASYPICYQLEHVCRSIVQIDEESLRDVKFIEMEGPPGGQPVKVERHQWVRDYVVSTWSKEMMTVAFRKVMDAIKGAEERTLAGVQFRVADETDEEKFRRLIGELKETGEELPDDLREAILKEEGLLGAVTESELEDLEARSKAWSREDHPDPEASTLDVPSAEPVPVPEPAPAPRAPQQLVEAQTQPVPAARVPMNLTPIRDPVPVNTAEQGVVMANRRPGAPPPDQVHTLSRSERVAALEDDPNLGFLRREAQVEPEQAQRIIDRPPAAGVNPKYVNPHTNPIRVGGLNPRARR